MVKQVQQALGGDLIQEFAWADGFFEGGCLWGIGQSAA